MFYGIIRAQDDNAVLRFIEDEDEIAIAYETEADAYDDLKEHVAFSVIDIIEID
jgi:hypothetical protein